MIPLLFILGGALVLADTVIKDAQEPDSPEQEPKKLSFGDYIPEKTVQIGDEVVLKFKNDSWLELYEDSEYPTLEIPYQSGENFEIKVFDIDDYQYHVEFEDGTLAFIPKNEVDIVAINDEVGVFKKGGQVKSFKVAKKSARKTKENMDHDESRKKVLELFEKMRKEKDTKKLQKMVNEVEEISKKEGINETETEVLVSIKKKLEKNAK